MKKILLILTTIALFAACSGNEDILSQKKMAHILRDIHLSDGTLNTQRYTLSQNVNIDSLYLYKKVFEKNGVTHDEFVNSLLYYSKYPRMLDEIYTMVVNDLSAKQAILREELDKKNKKPTNLKEVKR